MSHTESLGAVAVEFVRIFRQASSKNSKWENVIPSPEINRSSWNTKKKRHKRIGRIRLDKKHASAMLTIYIRQHMGAAAAAAFHLENKQTV
ncbi:hypothetical protein BV898_00994 [Hypsibius exemplaris]|uniref:Uncharacterized protein n=1 Tax=Hypsibius exemplaris TaxID=2072580 RepID=A0A1W0XDC3_HYPEX|nr:hypothetical protein BV898_00994 [Hypsibius exemplaris]